MTGVRTMGVTVYGDVLFLINFSMDFLVLFCTAKILHIKQKPVLLIISSVSGGIYAVAALFIENNAMSVICNILCALLMCFIAFPRVRGFAFLKCAALFFGLSLLTGGGITASYVLLSKLGRGVNVNSDIAPLLSDIPLGTFCILGVLSMILSFITGKIFNKQSAKKEVAVTVTGSHGQVTLRCLSDSGSLLREPVSGTPVIITSPERIKDCVDERLFDALSSSDISKTADGLRLIPAKSIGGGRLLPGFLPERVNIKGCDRTAVIAVTEDADFGGFDGIVPAALCL